MRPLTPFIALILLSGCNFDNADKTENKPHDISASVEIEPAPILVNSPMYFGPWKSIGTDKHSVAHQGKQIDVTDTYLIRRLWYEVSDKSTGKIVGDQRTICMQIIIERDSASTAIKGRVGEYNVECTRSLEMFSGHVALSEKRSPFFDKKVQVALRKWNSEKQF